MDVQVIASEHEVGCTRGVPLWSSCKETENCSQEKPFTRIKKCSNKLIFHTYIRIIDNVSLLVIEE